MSENQSSSIGLWIIAIILIVALLRIVASSKKPNNGVDSKLDPSQISALTIIPGYSSCEQSEFPTSCDSIFNIWNVYRLENTEALIKAKLVSTEYIQKFKSYVSDALHLEKKELKELQFVDQLRIVQQRHTLLEFYTIEELNDQSDINIGADALFLTMSLQANLLELTKIKFIDDISAYGIYPIFGEEKSVFFKREKEGWKINIFQEDPIFTSKREKLEHNMLNNYNSTEEYIIDFFGDKKYLEKIKN